MNSTISTYTYWFCFIFIFGFELVTYLVFNTRFTLHEQIVFVRREFFLKIFINLL